MWFICTDPCKCIEKLKHPVLLLTRCFGRSSLVSVTAYHHALLTVVRVPRVEDGIFRIYSFDGNVTANISVVGYSALSGALVFVNKFTANAV